MPDKVFAFGRIKKLMGRCPACRKMALQTKQPCKFSNTASVSGKTGNTPEFRTSNVLFPANTSLSITYFMISFSLLLRLEFPEEISYFLAGLLLFNTSYYLLVLKTFEAAVLVDKFGVHLQAFRLKKFEIAYEEIESVTSHKLEKRSEKMSLLLVIGGIALCGFFVYIAVAEGEWKPLLLLVLILPLLLFMEKKQKTRLLDLNTQLYIKTRHKKWYEWDSYYSLVTDEVSAAEIKSLIESHCEGA